MRRPGAAALPSGRTYTAMMVGGCALGAVAACNAATGVFSDRPRGPGSFTDPTGVTVALWGRGIYALDPASFVPVVKAVDLVHLLVVVPILLGSLVLHRRHPSPRLRVLVVAAAAMCTHVALDRVFHVRYNPLFLLYCLQVALGAVVTLRTALHVAPHDHRTDQSLVPYEILTAFLVATALAMLAGWGALSVTSLAGAMPLPVTSSPTFPGVALNAAVFGTGALLLAVAAHRRSPRIHVVAPLFVAVVTGLSFTGAAPVLLASPAFIPNPLVRAAGGAAALTAGVVGGWLTWRLVAALPAETPPTVTSERHRPPRSYLGLELTALAAAAVNALNAAVGYFSNAPGAASSTSATTVWGATVALQGRGVYALEAARTAAILRSVDLFVLLVVTGVLLLAVVLHHVRRSPRCRVFIAAGLALTAYHSLQRTASVHPSVLFPTYPLALTLAAYGAVWAGTTIAPDDRWINQRAMPYRSVMAVSGFMATALLVVWLPASLRLAWTAQGPPEIGTMSTFVRPVVDLGLIVPGCLMLIHDLWHRRLAAHVATPVLTLILSQVGMLAVFQMVLIDDPVHPLLTSPARLLVFLGLSAVGIALTIRSLQALPGTASGVPDDRRWIGATGR